MLTCPLLNVFGRSPFPHQLVHVLNMMSAKILTYSVSDDETVADLQLRIEKDTSIPAANQELLLEAGLALEPQGLVMQCAVDYAVISQISTVHTTRPQNRGRAQRINYYCSHVQEIDGRRTDLPLVFLFDRSSCSYEPQFSPRTLPENICFVSEYTSMSKVKTICETSSVSELLLLFLHASKHRK